MSKTSFQFGKRKQAPSERAEYLFDTSGFFSNGDKFTVKRDSDNAIEVFSPVDLADGTYTAWLNGANGIVEEIINDGSLNISLINERGTTAKLLTSGLIDFYQDNLVAGFNLEVTENSIFAFVVRDLNNFNNQRYNFGVMAGDSAFSMNHRSGANRFYVGWKFKAGDIQTYYINTPSLAQSGSDNVVVAYFSGGLPVLLVNGVTYSSRVLSDDSWSWIGSDITYNRLIVGSRYLEAIKPGKYRHFATHIVPTKTPQEIHDELVSIYQT